MTLHNKIYGTFCKVFVLPDCTLNFGISMSCFEMTWKTLLCRRQVEMPSKLQGILFQHAVLNIAQSPFFSTAVQKEE